VAKFLTLTNHIYTNQFFMINEKTWQSLSDQDKTVIAAAAKVDQELERNLAVKLHTDIIDRVKREGITVIPIDTKPLQNAVTPIYQEYGKKIGGMELIEKVVNTR